MSEMLCGARERKLPMVADSVGLPVRYRTGAVLRRMAWGAADLGCYGYRRDSALVAAWG